MKIKTRLKKKFGRERETTEQVSKVLKNKFESWGSFGNREKFYSLFITVLEYKPLTFLKERFVNSKTKPQIMFLGPGRGGYIPIFKSALKSKNIIPEIDVFALKKSISENVKKEIKTDFSSKIPFEKLNTKTSNKNVKKLQEAFLHKYDLIMAPLSVGFHTLYPANALFTTALMLKTGGKAYIQVSPQFSQQYLFTGSPSNKKNFEVLKNMDVVFQRFVDSYNKQNNNNLKYTLNRITKTIDNKNIIYFEIERIK